MPELLSAALIPLRLIEGLLICALIYHYLFIVSATRTSGVKPPAPSRLRRFAIVIPAHNEAAVIEATIACAHNLCYSAHLYTVNVVADHCTDATANIAQAAGATVHVRSAEPGGRKGYALSWIFAHLLEPTPRYDAIVVLDADSHIDSNFLSIMNAELDRGEMVLQGQRIVNNADDSPLAAIAAVDQRLNNLLRNQARTNLGLSCRLMGDAMCFAVDILCAHPWNSDSLVEDREYGASLLLQGVTTHYIRGAIVHQQAAVNWKSGQQQRLRWSRGAVEVQRRMARRLFTQGLRQRSLRLIDGGLELMMPAYTSLMALTMILVAIEALLAFKSGSVGLVLMSITLLAWLAYPALGLIIDRAPWSMFKAILYGPIFLVWRLWLGLLTRLLGSRIQWVRTQRREETPTESGAPSSEGRS